MLGKTVTVEKHCLDLEDLCFSFVFYHLLAVTLDRSSSRGYYELHMRL